VGGTDIFERVRGVGQGQPTQISDEQVVVVVVRVVVTGGGLFLVVVVVVVVTGGSSSSSVALVVVVVVVDVALVVLVVDEVTDVGSAEVVVVPPFGRWPGGMGSTAAPRSRGFWLAAPFMIPVVKSAAVRAPTTAPTASRPGPLCRVAPIRM
jgi:hypothetical protein